MAKKTRRSRRKRKTTPTPVVKQRPQPALVQEVSAEPGLDLSQEYAYVFTDLRRIAIIAAVMFALLFALAFALR